MRSDSQLAIARGASDAGATGARPCSTGGARAASRAVRWRVAPARRANEAADALVRALLWP